MFLLPRTNEDFLKTEYWDTFFKKRGKEAFEWYGEYQELCGILHRYIKPSDKILVIGCGNSAVSSNLYDLGYKNITNIDVSGVVIKRMQQKYGRKRPGLNYLQMDALQTDFPTTSFSTIFDKGTLDALFTDGTDESKERIGRLFNEIDRLLKIGGRYVCVSLLQTHILNFVLDYFFEKGWLIRVCRCIEVEKNRADGSCMPVFAVVCTKIKKLPNFEPVIEISMDDNNVIRTGKEMLIKTINSIQQAEAVCSGLNRNCLSDGEKEAVIEVARPGDSSTRYTITVVDPPKPVSVDKMKFVAFVVPLGKEKDWTFGSEEGRQTLRDYCRVDRMAMISMHEGHEYPDFKGVQTELEDTIIKLAPKGVTDRSEKVTFLTMADDLKVDQKNVRVKGETKFSGEYLVEDVIEDGEHYRRLIFSSRGTLIQSEVKLKQQQQQQQQDEAGETTEEVDLNYIVCDYYVFLNVGISLAVEQCEKPKYEVLVLGLGGGVLTTLIHKCFENVAITAIEIDPVIYEVAKEHFCFKPDERMNVIIEDGLVFLAEAARKGTKFDAIVYDVDNKDTKVGISCPPVSFLEPRVLNNVVRCLNDKGLFLLNLACRSLELKKEILERLSCIFAGVVSFKTKEDINEVVICWKKKALQIDVERVETAAQKFKIRTMKHQLSIDEELLSMHLNLWKL